MKIKFVTVIIICLLLLFSSCATEDTTMYDAVQYSNAQRMQFHNHTGGLIQSMDALERRGYTHFIFLLSEEEFLMGEFPNDAFIAWPSLFTYMMLKEINLWLGKNEESIALEDYTLTYPLTMEDMVDNWRNVQKLWESIEPIGYRDIWWSAYRRYNSVMLSELEILSEAFEVAGIDVSESGLYLPLSTMDFIGIDNMRSIMNLYNMLEENIQLQLLHEISNLMARYRNELRAAGL